MMRGTVYAVNKRIARWAVKTDGHGYTIIETSSSDTFTLGDVLEWDSDTGMGGQTYRNLSHQNEAVSVFVQNHWVSDANLRQQLGA